MSTSGQSPSKRIQQMEEKAEDLIAEISSFWNEPADCDIKPLLNYEERISETEDTIRPITQQLDVDIDDLQTIEEEVVILRRIKMAVHAQSSTRKQVLDQRLDYLSAWLSELRALAEKTSIDPEMSKQLTRLVQWADRSRKFLDRDNYIQLLSDSGSYNVDSLEAHIKEIEQSIRQSADSSTEQAYLRDVAAICSDALSTVVDRIERVVGSEPAERETIVALESDIKAPESVDNLMTSLTDLRQLYAEYEREANQLIEIAVFLDAVEDAYATGIQGIQNQINNVRTELKNRNLENARLQVKQLVSRASNAWSSWTSRNLNTWSSVERSASPSSLALSNRSLLIDIAVFDTVPPRPSEQVLADRLAMATTTRDALESESVLVDIPSARRRQIRRRYNAGDCPDSLTRRQEPPYARQPG